jgi:hypothetical protein
VGAHVSSATPRNVGGLHPQLTAPGQDDPVGTDGHLWPAPGILLNKWSVLMKPWVNAKYIPCARALMVGNGRANVQDSARHLLITANSTKEDANDDAM